MRALVAVVLLVPLAAAAEHGVPFDSIDGTCTVWALLHPPLDVPPEHCAVRHAGTLAVHDCTEATCVVTATGVADVLLPAESLFLAVQTPDEGRAVCWGGGLARCEGSAAVNMTRGGVVEIRLYSEAWQAWVVHMAYQELCLDSVSLEAVSC